ncbi:hypothetical protein [Actinocorallia sp. A-T 12471]|uniref:hypothetical protein n=1 Tax=Actinocorallia sp. A-T 12471 TaxID=3089813 RepID=UPI0029CD61FD|nr:hypothetical protein [Actinocorallia sp. A-T 12471]MDX6739758.1 hypothetical protein [Actinocorallia sp. A-T 12471]
MSPAVLVLGGFGLLILLLAAVLLVVLSDDGKGGGTPVATPSAPGFDAKYAGTWTGPVIQIKPTSARFIVTVVIAEGSTTGQIKLENDPTSTSTGAFSCSGTLTFLHHTPNYDFKSVVQESITQSQGSVTCDALSYSTLFPNPDNNGGSNDGLYYKTYFNESAADRDSDHNAIGELKRQSGANA